MAAGTQRTITIGVYGGVVQWMRGIPGDVRVVVHDYDIEGVEAHRLSRDESGHECVDSIWEAAEANLTI